MSRLITTSLIESVNWAKTAPRSPCDENTPDISWSQKAYTDLKNTLGRAAWEPDSWLKRGIEFEQLVYTQTAAHVDPETSNGSEFFKTFLREAQGAVLYRKTKMFRELDGEEYCIYGKLDLFWPTKPEAKGKIKDIKTTKKFGGKDKYLKSVQHKIYCLNEGIEDFEYLIAEFADPSDERKITGMFRVPYHVDSFKNVEDEVMQSLKTTVDYLKSFDGRGELWDLYLTKYCRQW